MHALAGATGWPVLVPRFEGEPRLRDEDAGGYRLWSFRGSRHPEWGFRASFRVDESITALRRLIHATPLVHFHHLAHLDLGLPALARSLGRTVVWTLHDYHLLCIRGQLVDRALAPCPGPSAARCEACVVEHLGAPPIARRIAPFAGPLTGPLRRLVRLRGAGQGGSRALRARLDTARAAMGAAHRILAPSADLAARVRALGWAEEVHVQDLPLVAPLRPRPAGEGPLRFLFVGSLIPTKGPEVLVRAFGELRRRLPAGTAPPSLTLYGPRPPFDGAPDYADRVLRLLEQTPGARYGGVFGDREREGVYGEADVLVLPSLWEENSPLVVREARAAGLRVVASRVGGIAEIDREARLVTPRDPEALVRALLAECARGRARRDARSYSMDEHIAAITRHHDAAQRGRTST